MATGLLIIHALVAVALLGAITHQTLAAWAPASARPSSFFGRFRAVRSASFANSVVAYFGHGERNSACEYRFASVDPHRSQSQICCAKIQSEPR